MPRMGLRVAASSPSTLRSQTRIGDLYQATNLPDAAHVCACRSGRLDNEAQQLPRPLSDEAKAMDPPLSHWEDFEERAFLVGMRLFGKDFDDIHSLVPTKSTAELVQYYYQRFKFSGAYVAWKAALFIDLVRRCGFHDAPAKLQEASKQLASRQLEFDVFMKQVTQAVGLRVLVDSIAAMSSEPDTDSESDKDTPATTIEEVEQKLQCGESRASVFWNHVWPRLSKAGWHHEAGRRPTDKFFFPPGIQRGMPGVRNRHEYFDAISPIMSMLQQPDSPATRDFHRGCELMAPRRRDTLLSPRRIGAQTANGDVPSAPVPDISRLVESAAQAVLRSDLIGVEPTPGGSQRWRAFVQSADESAPPIELGDFASRAEAAAARDILALVLHGLSCARNFNYTYSQELEALRNLTVDELVSHIKLTAGARLPPAPVAKQESSVPKARALPSEERKSPARLAEPSLVEEDTVSNRRPDLHKERVLTASLKQNAPTAPTQPLIQRIRAEARAKRQTLTVDIEGHTQHDPQEKRLKVTT
eukprot:jgi/Chlat1/2498/Chrsp175S08713